MELLKIRIAECEFRLTNWRKFYAVLDFSENHCVIFFLNSKLPCRPYFSIVHPYTGNCILWFTNNHVQVKNSHVHVMFT